MSTREVSGFQISGYFSRIFGRRTDQVKALASRVLQGTDSGFQGLQRTYQTFDRAKTPVNSKSLAKEIVKIEIQETGPRSRQADVVAKAQHALLQFSVIG